MDWYIRYQTQTHNNLVDGIVLTQRKYPENLFDAMMSFEDVAIKPRADNHLRLYLELSLLKLIILQKLADKIVAYLDKAHLWSFVVLTDVLREIFEDVKRKAEAISTACSAMASDWAGTERISDANIGIGQALDDNFRKLIDLELGVQAIQRELSPVKS